MNILLDTNVAIVLDPLAPEEVEERTPQAVELARLAAVESHILFVHPASNEDVDRDTDPQRRSARQMMLGKYQRLSYPPTIPPSVPAVIGNPEPGTNDWVDNQLLATVMRDAVDFLVTADDGIHRKAARLGIETRVVTVADAVLLLRSLSGRQPIRLPRLDLIPAHALDEADPLVASIRSEYGGSKFDTWFSAVKRGQRPALAIVGPSKALQAVALLKHDDDEPRIGGRVLKLSTFRVGEEWRGNRFGELLLKGVLQYTNQNHFDAVWVSVPLENEGLAALFEDFGFLSIRRSERPGESVFIKRMTPTESEWHRLSPFEFHIKFGPPAVKLVDGDVFVVPIQPRFHGALFPEGESNLPLLVDAFGNSIRKAYLSRAPIRRIREGSGLLFYRSRDLRALTAIGVVESILISSDALTVQHFVGNRTVYSAKQVAELCLSEVLAILFRHDRMLEDPIELKELLDNGVLNGPPQTITMAAGGTVDWLMNRIRA